MSVTIHATAVVDPAAELGVDVCIGPYCVIGPEVCLGDGTELKSHVVVEGRTALGPGCVVHPFACLGGRTQDLKYKGGRPGVTVGAETTIREYVTINAATDDGDFTRVGARCLLMAYCHVAHDCQVGNEVIIANCGTLAGHIQIADQVIIGGLSGAHQFVRLGRMCIIGGCSKVVQDVPPFMLADGHPLAVRGLNKIGLERRGVAPEAQAILKQAYRLLYRQQLTTAQALERMATELPTCAELEELLAFVRTSERGITR